MTSILNNSSVLLFLIGKFHQGVAICDIQQNIILWNEEAEKIAGAHVKSVAEADWVYHQQFRKRDGQSLEECDRALYRAMKEEKETQSQTMYIDKGGNKIYLDARAYPLYNNDKTLVGAVAFFKDVTNQIKMEKLLTEIEEKLKEMQDYLKSFSL